MAPSKPHPPISTTVPPLLLGTATFNHQYVSDPLAMPYRDIVSRAIALGLKGFDTSPYYGPSEVLLGTALESLMNPTASASNPLPIPLERESIFLVTKAGRITGDEFDYSPAWIRYSILRSLQRLHTEYLDLVYMHDVEFVSPEEVLTAVKELRRLRDEEGLVRYVGISGFPADVLASLAEMILAETGEPLDAVLSYGHFTVQNRKLALTWVAGEKKTEEFSSPLARLKRAGVDVVLNASILGMGLLTNRGIPPDERNKTSPLAKWHPSPPELRVACKSLADITATIGERLESVAIRWSLQEWARIGAAAGVGVQVPSTVSGNGTARVGVTVCGVSSIGELEETVAEWRGVLSSLGHAVDGRVDATYGPERQNKVNQLVEKQLWPALGKWVDYAWDSPGPGYVNTRREEDKGRVPSDSIVAGYNQRKAVRSGIEPK
ncbi:Aldo/keto reductase family-domain-containing protein [Triangularia verruculosa]|uniref:Aldo/keto reductase family-domain-containing protein n=1 Tax=Triangularia verruculosa TaxID=2587418 RepID=A0AAN7AY38_9PEZI|nr:Aldo/keto reductase family-domain-containing protein [Triangularia verruculosa]